MELERVRIRTADPHPSASSHHHPVL